MKNSLLHYYTVAFYLCSTFVIFADPGTGTDDATPLESGDTPAPIDDYVWVLAVLGLVFVFMKYRAIQKDKIQG